MINNLNFKSQIPFYYPRGRNVDRAEILAREAEYRQMIEEGEEGLIDESVSPYRGEHLSDDELNAKLREIDHARSQIQIDAFTPSDEDEEAAKTPIMPVFQTEEVLTEETRKLDIRG